MSLFNMGTSICYYLFITTHIKQCFCMLQISIILCTNPVLMITCFRHNCQRQYQATQPAETETELWSLTKMGLTESGKTHFITSQEPPSGPETQHVKSSSLKGGLGIILIPLSEKDYVWGRNRFHQYRIVTLQPALHTACIKAITLQEWRGWA